VTPSGAGGSPVGQARCSARAIAAGWATCRRGRVTRCGVIVRRSWPSSAGAAGRRVPAGVAEPAPFAVDVHALVTRSGGPQRPRMALGCGELRIVNHPAITTVVRSACSGASPYLRSGASPGTQRCAHVSQSATGRGQRWVRTWLRPDEQGTTENPVSTATSASRANSSCVSRRLRL
jgi:hypothetical protein